MLTVGELQIRVAGTTDGGIPCAWRCAHRATGACVCIATLNETGTGTLRRRRAIKSRPFRISSLRNGRATIAM
eukprot:5475169-Lingulodinium_polyedra.AAC.1